MTHRRMLVLGSAAAILALTALTLWAREDTAQVAASDTGYKNPSANAAASGGDGNGWESNPTYAYAYSDSQFASNVNGPGDRHDYYNFNLYGTGASQVPAGARIDGIKVGLIWWTDSTNWNPKLQVQLSGDGGTNWTTAKSTSTGQTSWRLDELGNASDLWPTYSPGWTAESFTNTNFRVRIKATCDDEFWCGARDYYLDWVGVQVYWTDGCTIDSVLDINSGDQGLEWDYNLNKVFFGLKITPTPAGTPYFAMFRMKPDGTPDPGQIDSSFDSQVVTIAGTPYPMAGKNRGNGDYFTYSNTGYIIFTAEMAKYKHAESALPTETPGAYCAHSSTEPGKADCTDAWIMKADGSQYWKMTSLDGMSPWAKQGVLWPRVSPDGTKVTFAVKINALGQSGDETATFMGNWLLCVANLQWDGSGNPLPFVTQPVDPVNYNTTCYTPGGFNLSYLTPTPTGTRSPSWTATPTPMSGSFYEPTEWLDNNRFVYAGDVWRVNAQGTPTTSQCEIDQWIFDVTSPSNPTLLTDPGASTVDWDEHAHAAHSSNKIVWSTNTDYSLTCDIMNITPDLKMEIWAMNTDGTNQTQLTFFNTVGAPGYISGYHQRVMTPLFSPDHRYMLVQSPKINDSTNETTPAVKKVNFAGQCYPD